MYLFLLLTTILRADGRTIGGDVDIITPGSFGVGSGQTPDHCTDQKLCHCQLSMYGLVADCSHRKIKYIPTFDANVSVIYLQGNQIRNLSGQGIPSRVIYLDMSSNELDSIDDSFFHNFNQLRYLDLSQNNLQYNSLIYSGDIFQGLTKLTHLNLKQNNMKFTLRSLNFPTSISTLTSVEELLMDGVDLVGFEEGFSQLKQLKLLDLSGSSGVCHLRTINSDFFKNISVVEKLDISNCNIHEIHLGAFRSFKHLHFLNISRNECLTFRVLENVTSDLPYTAIRHFDISRLHCTFGPGTVLHRRDIFDIINTNLTHMYIDSNRLSMLEIGTVKQLPKTLRYISVVDNKLSFGLYDVELSSLPNIEIIHAEYQGVPHNFQTGSSDCNDWRAPPASYDVISFGGSSELLSCNRNPLSNVHHNSRTLTLIQLPYSVRELYYSHNSMNFEVGNIHFRDNNLTYVDLSNNLFHSWKGPLSNLPHLKYVDLSNNFCSYVSKDFAMKENIVETLLLGNNLLGLVLNTDFNGDTFQNLKRLKKLDLSTNHILTLHTAVLRNQYNLEFLNLSNNALVEFGIDLEHMENLKYLDLTFNYLKRVKREQRYQIDQLRHNNITLNLKGNVMSCVCEEIEFLEWVAKNKNIFQDYHLYKCVFGNRSEVSFTDRTLIELSKSCDSYIGVIVVFSSLILFSLSLIVTGIIYRYRWKLRYLYYMAKTRYKGYRPVVHAEEEDDDYQYDAFISYCSDDFQFVRNELLRNLEENKGLRLCLHQRDFVPGNEIAQNITNAIHQSRKTVIILSKNYLNSYWCMFEFNMARMESIYSRGGDSILVLVFFEDIPARELPLTLLDLIESDSYIEYPTEDVHGTIVFWDKLASSISEYTTTIV